MCKHKKGWRQLDLQWVLSSRSLEAVGIEMTVGSSGLHWPGKCSIVHKNGVFTAAQRPAGGRLGGRCSSIQEESDSETAAAKHQSTILYIIKVFMND